MSSLYDKIHYWLSDYVAPEEHHHVSSLIYHMAKKYAWAAFRAGLLIGAIGAIILVRWAS